MMKFDDVYIELVEAFPSSSKEELRKKEGEWIRRTPNAVNRCVAGRTDREWKDDNREKIRDYDERTKDHRNEQRRKRYRVRLIESSYTEAPTQYPPTQTPSLRMKSLPSETTLDVPVGSPVVSFPKLPNRQKEEGIDSTLPLHRNPLFAAAKTVPLPTEPTTALPTE